MKDDEFKELARRDDSTEKNEIKDHRKQKRSQAKMVCRDGQS